MLLALKRIGFIERDVDARVARDPSTTLDNKWRRRSNRRTADSIRKTRSSWAYVSANCAAFSRSTMAINSVARCAVGMAGANARKPVRRQAAAASPDRQRRVRISRAICSPSRATKIILARREQVFRVVPRRAQQRYAAGERLEHSDRWNARQHRDVKAARHVDGCECRAKISGARALANQPR